MSQPQTMEKTLMASLGYAILAGFWFGIKYQSFIAGLIASVLCGGLYISGLTWGVKWLKSTK